MELETCSGGGAPDVGGGRFGGPLLGASGNGSCRPSASTPSVVRDASIGSCASASADARASPVWRPGGMGWRVGVIMGGEHSRRGVRMNVCRAPREAAVPRSALGPIACHRVMAHDGGETTCRSMSFSARNVGKVLYSALQLASMSAREQRASSVRRVAVRRSCGRCRAFRSRRPRRAETPPAPFTRAAGLLFSDM